MSRNYINRILSAKVYDVAHETPIDRMPALSRELDNEVIVKREDLQPVFSFKLRGAYNKVAHLTAAQRSRGVITASAGNHAQGVALAAFKLRTRAIIVMPRTTPLIKNKAVKALGGDWVEVVMYGDRFDEACRHALSIARRRNLTFIHPYDDPDVIAGQGTIGMEIFRQWSGPLDAIFVPVGGGGLIAGVGTYVKYLHPGTRVIGVESEESACLQAALKARKRIKLPKIGIFADGVAVAMIGREPFRLAQSCVDSVITVSNDEICAAIKLMFDDTRSIAEPAGALSLAGLIKYVKKKHLRGQTLLNINSGANVNFDRLRYVSERFGVGQQTEAMLAVTIPEKPGALVSLCEGLKGHDISEFNYRYQTGEHAHIFVGVKVGKDRADRQRLFAKLRGKGFQILDMSGNELAKSHVCHMVGGGASLASRERIFRLEFAERVGILREFLTVMQNRWNISLFHYRQHGGTYANVLVGLQEIPGSRDAIEDFLKKLNYPYVEETNNPAYRLFLTSH